jgi:hypothetical protein
MMMLNTWKTYFAALLRPVEAAERLHSYAFTAFRRKQVEQTRPNALLLLLSARFAAQNEMSERNSIAERNRQRLFESSRPKAR